MNAPVGTNPRGGVAWADVRAANGHPEPWGVTRWEVGNEHDRVDQRYWMSADAATAMRQYAYGGSELQAGQRLGRGCDFRTNVTGDGTPRQQMAVAYPPVAPDSQTVRVGGVAWQEVSDLTGAQAGDRVYTIDDATGEVEFGDGVHGAVPGKGAVVDADYVSGPHAGFVDLQRAMKEADPGIDVCATWAPITEDTGLGGESLPDLLASRGDADLLDCLVVHPYTNFGRQFGSTVDTARTLHDWHMLGEAAATGTLRHYADELKAAVGSSGYLTTTEFGALFFGAGDIGAYPSWNTAMSHVTYMASQWARLADLGVPWAEGNTLISENSAGLRAVLGGAPGFTETSEHVVRAAMRPFVEGGGSVVGHEVRENPAVTTSPTDLGSSYPALVTTASMGADGRVRVLVVNRDPDRDLPGRLVAPGFHRASDVEVVRVVGANPDPGRESFESHNSLSHPHEVRSSRELVQVPGAGAVPMTFPRHSVTLVTLSPR
jgi:alpha-N-arabinofuranosidase